MPRKVIGESERKKTEYREFYILKVKQVQWLKIFAPQNLTSLSKTFNLIVIITLPGSLSISLCILEIPSFVHLQTVPLLDEWYCFIDFAPHQTKQLYYQTIHGIKPISELQSPKKRGTINSGIFSNYSPKASEYRWICLVPRRFRLHCASILQGRARGEKPKIRREAPGRICIQDGGYAYAPATKWRTCSVLWLTSKKRPEAKYISHEHISWAKTFTQIFTRDKTTSLETTIKNRTDVFFLIFSHVSI